MSSTKHHLPPPPPNTPLPKSEQQHLTNAIPVNIPTTTRGFSHADGVRSDELISSRDPPSLMPDQGPSEPESPKHSSWNTIPDSTSNSWVTTDDCAIEDDSDDEDNYKELLTFQRSPPMLTPCQSLISLMLARQKVKEKAPITSQNDISSSPSSPASAIPASTVPGQKKASRGKSTNGELASDKDSEVDDRDDVLEMKTTTKASSAQSQPINIHPRVNDNISRRTPPETPQHSRQRQPRPQKATHQLQRQFVDPYKGKKRDLYNMSYSDWILEHSPGFHDRGW